MKLLVTDRFRNANDYFANVNPPIVNKCTVVFKFCWLLICLSDYVKQLDLLLRQKAEAIALLRGMKHTLLVYIQRSMTD